jgi:hypothetical protein
VKSDFKYSIGIFLDELRKIKNKAGLRSGPALQLPGVPTSIGRKTSQE